MKPVMKKDGNSEDICLGEKEKKRSESDYRERVGLSSTQVRTLFLKREQPLPSPLPKSPELPAKDLGFLGPTPEAQHWDCAGGEQIQGLCIWNQYLRLFLKKRGG